MTARNKRLSLLVFPILAIFLISLPAWTAARTQGAQPATVRVTPALVQLDAGGTVELGIEVVDVQGLYGFDFQLVFNPSVVEVVDADPARPGVQVLPGNFLETGFVAVNEVDNITGTLRFVMTQFNPSQPKSGTGTLIRLQLRGLRGGASTPITPTFAELADRDGEALPVVLIPGRAEVSGTPGAQPTNTLAPTQAGTTPAPTGQPGYPEPTQPGYPAPESPTPPPAGGYPAAPETVPASRTPRPAVTVQEPVETAGVEAGGTVTSTPALEAPESSVQPGNPEGTALLETAIILCIILVFAVGAIFIFIQLTRS